MEVAITTDSAAAVWNSLRMICSPTLHYCSSALLSIGKKKGKIDFGGKKF
jgi:hypothetical protein